MKEIRRNPDGSVDDVAVKCKMFRLEQLEDTVWWAAAYDGKKAVHFDLWLEDGVIKCQSRDDSIGCKNVVHD